MWRLPISAKKNIGFEDVAILNNGSQYQYGLTISFVNATTIDSYAFKTAESQPEKDPREWSLYGSMDKASWTRVAVVAQKPYDTSCARLITTPQFPVLGPVAYYRFVPIKNGKSDGQVILGDLILHYGGKDVDVNGQGSSFTSIGKDTNIQDALDGDKNTVWQCITPSNVQACAITIILYERMPIDSYSVIQAPGDNDNDRRYILDWRLEASSDGLTWPSLDEQVQNLSPVSGRFSIDTTTLRGSNV